MGLIALPNLDAIMGIQDPNKRFEELVNVMGILIKNLSELNGYMNAKNIKAHSITADRMDVTELSAISANLGHITAGLIEAIEIFGSYIATAAIGSYPRVEFSSTSNMIKAETSATQYLRVDAQIGSDSAGITLVDNLLRAFFQAAAGHLFIGTLTGSGSITIRSGDDLYLRADDLVRFDSWSDVYSDGDAQTLASALNNLASAISGLSGTVSNHEDRISALESP